ncbi:MAG: ABC transporter ATP-binding protein [Clostridia bacterium]|nr:ABC transporter ATP-binding protein [Clostridia bacterium]
MFEIKDLRFAYKHSAPVLKGVDLSLECGEIGVLLGKNGAGKSTLFKCVLGLLKPQGEMLFDGQDIVKTSRAERAKLIAYVPQEISLGDLTVFDCVLTGRIAHFGVVATREDREIVGQVLKELGLEDLAHKNANCLSGGERQKVAIARALAQEPKMLVFDEPTGNLDIQNEQLIFDIAKKIAREKNITILIAIHNINFAFAFGDKFFLMKDGKIKHAGSMEILNEETIKDVFGLNVKLFEVEGHKGIIMGG